ncbi:MAG: VOC family protein [Myxococcales bacterium]
MSTTISPYVNFDGNCVEAVQFWADAIGAQTQMMRMGESPMPVAESAKNRVMHAAVRKGGLLLLASDCIPGQPLVRGNSVSLCLNFTDQEEQDQVWNKLSVGG